MELRYRHIRPVLPVESIIYEEVIMIEVTEAATQKVADYFNGKEIVPIRIFLNEGG